VRPAALAVLLAASASAQTGLPGYDKAPEKTAPAVSLSTAAADSVAPSTAAVSASSATVAAPTDEALHGGIKKGGGEPKVKLSRPMHATVHKDAVDWEPIGLREGGDPGQAETSVTLRLVKSKGKLKGEVSRAKATARVHKGKKDSVWLLVSIWPKSLEKKRTHFEIRFRVFEGFVEELEVAAVKVTDRRALPKPLDSDQLRAEGIEYEAERPGSGLVVVSALDPKPSKTARNSGKLEKAEFADKDLGFVSLSWSATGVAK
jgi:hypothetical protein